MQLNSLKEIKVLGTRARKTAQELKAALQQFRGEILEHSKTEKNA